MKIKREFLIGFQGRRRKVEERIPQERRTVENEVRAAIWELDYGKYRMNRRESLRYYLTACSAFFFLGILFYKSLLLSIAMMCVAVFLKGKWEERLAEKRREELTAQFRDLLYGLSASVSAGRQLAQAFCEAGEQLGSSYGKTSILYMEVENMVHSMKESRQTAEELLESLARRSCVSEIRQFAHICRICRGSGGDMERVIGKTASVLMERIALKREIRMLTAQKRLEAQILTAIPVAMVLGLNLLSPDYLSALYEGIPGRLIMTAALLGMGCSYWLSRKITEICL